jgi:predicted methyltransferase
MRKISKLTKPSVAKTRHSVSLLIAALLIASCARLKQFAYEGFDRDNWQHPEKVIAALRLQPGNIVADLGSGGGYFTFRLAKAVAPTGKIYAVDTDPDMIDLIENRAKKETPSQVEPILAKPDDPCFPRPASI